MSNYNIKISRKRGWIAKGVIVAVGYTQPRSELVKFQVSMKSRVSSTKLVVLVGEGMSMTCVEVDVERVAA